MESGLKSENHGLINPNFAGEGLQRVSAEVVVSRRGIVKLLVCVVYLVVVHLGYVLCPSSS